MEKLEQFIKSEVFKYLFFGVLTTVVYAVIRILFFAVFHIATFSAIVASIISVIFAFWTNDRFVFNQRSEGWQKRFIKFTSARIMTLFMDLILAKVLVDSYPQLIGQFVGGNLSLVNAIETGFSQFLIIVLNYIISKFFVFTGKD